MNHAKNKSSSFGIRTRVKDKAYNPAEATTRLICSKDINARFELMLIHLF